MSVSAVLGVLLAGGRSSRMGGGDKSLRMLGGRPILARVIARARPQVADLIINANGDPARFAPFQLPVVPDTIADFPGPLAGILTAMEWAARQKPGMEWIVSFPTDAPFFPEDLVARLLDAVGDGKAEMACAASDGRTHPVFALWPVRLREALRQAMVAEGMRKIDAWTARYRIATVAFAAEPFDPFFNINRPENLAEAQDLLTRVGEAA